LALPALSVSLPVALLLAALLSQQQGALVAEEVKVRLLLFAPSVELAPSVVGWERKTAAGDGRVQRRKETLPVDRAGQDEEGLKRLLTSAAL
jgi:hypothetical protein